MQSTAAPVGLLTITPHWRTRSLSHKSGAEVVAVNAQRRFRFGSAAVQARRSCYATHSAVVPRAGGRLHRPDDAQVEPREVAVGRRAIASVGLLTTGSPRTRSSAQARSRDRLRMEALARSAGTGLLWSGSVVVGRVAAVASLVRRQRTRAPCAGRRTNAIVDGPAADAAGGAVGQALGRSTCAPTEQRGWRRHRSADRESGRPPIRRGTRSSANARLASRAGRSSTRIGNV